MLEIGKIYQIDNGYLLGIAPGLHSTVSFIYCKDHRELADTIVSKRVAEKLRGGRDQPEQQELDFDTAKQPFI